MKRLHVECSKFVACNSFIIRKCSSAVKEINAELGGIVGDLNGLKTDDDITLMMDKINERNVGESTLSSISTVNAQKITSTMADEINGELEELIGKLEYSDAQDSLSESQTTSATSDTLSHKTESPNVVFSKLKSIVVPKLIILNLCPLVYSMEQQIASLSESLEFEYEVQQLDMTAACAFDSVLDIMHTFVAKCIGNSNCKYGAVIVTNNDMLDSSVCSSVDKLTKLLSLYMPAIVHVVVSGETNRTASGADVPGDGICEEFSVARSSETSRKGLFVSMTVGGLIVETTDSAAKAKTSAVLGALTATQHYLKS